MITAIQWSGFMTIFLVVQMVHCEDPSSEMKHEPVVSKTESWKEATSVYDFTVNNIEGKPISLDKYKGNVLLIVNVASKCGLASLNYAQLVELDEKYRDRGLRILAFPSNQFANQEPGDAAEIMAFAKEKNATFDFFEKIEVNGDNASPLWKYLKAKQPGTFGIERIQWNYTKFMVDKNGQPVDRFAPTTMLQWLKNRIEELL